jgi:putative ABC transport system permease protein
VPNSIPAGGYQKYRRVTVAVSQKNNKAYSPYLYGIMTVWDSIQLAFNTVRSNRLRTGITVTIIAFGIMALIGIITAIKAMEQSLKESFSSMGANAFSIRFKESTVRFGRQSSTVKVRGRKEKKSNLNKYIEREDAEYFKQHYRFPAQVSIYLRGGYSINAVYQDKETNPVAALWGGDENYLAVNGHTLQAGRNLSVQEVQAARNVCVIGSNIAQKLFGDDHEKALEKIIKVSGEPYRVVGVLASKGTGGLMRQDDIIVTSYNKARSLSTASSSFIIGVLVNNVADLEPAIDEAASVFRGVRKLEPIEADNFAIEKSDKFAEMFIGFLSSITGSAGAVGMITLIGAAIGLMNIMLVAVSERTREVGLVKALGGKSKHVRRQFLFESMIISLLGAFFGIILGILVGNVFSALLKTGFVIPWLWVIMGIVICSVVGLVAGIYPAYKAARLNPIVALRYE